MKEYLPKSLRSVLQKARLLPDYIYALILLKRRENPRHSGKKGQIVIFDLTDPQLDRNFGRYTYLLIKFFSINGWHIVLKDSVEPVANLMRLRYKKWLLDIRELTVQSNPNYPNAIYVYDDPLKTHAVKPKQFVQLKDFEHGKTRDCDYQFPFTMHPFFYEKGRYQTVKELRSDQRLVRILFSGKMDHKLYTKPIFKERYNILNRIEIIEYLKRNLGSEQLLHLNSLDEFDQLVHNGSYHNQLVIGQRILKIGKWLEGLSKSDFFLACPGTDMPMCHNIIESMSVGCIPIIEFPGQLVPSLEDGVNCLAFSGKDELLQTVQKSFEMKDEEIARLRKGVIDYYEQNLSPEKVISDITQSGQNELSVCMEMS